MDVNKQRIRFDSTNDKEVIIPIEMNWDYYGQDQSIELFEEDVIEQIVGIGFDFEVNRFQHEVDNTTDRTEINYEFYFYSGGTTISSSSDWGISYLPQGLTNSDIYYFNNNFKKSFFKLDLYDTVDDKRQVNYLTIIIPTQQGYKIPSLIGTTPIDIKIPKFTLDFVGDKEGFFVYWLKKPQFIPINTFYMSAKFFNGETGQFVKMMNKPQSSVGTNVYNVDSTQYFYYKVVLNYINQTYTVFDYDLSTGTQTRVGTTTPIKWYQYVNP